MNLGGENSECHVADEAILKTNILQYCLSPSVLLLFCDMKNEA